MGTDVVAPILVLGIDVVPEMMPCGRSVGTVVVGAVVVAPVLVLGIDVVSEVSLLSSSIGTAVVGAVVVAACSRAWHRCGSGGPAL